MLLRDDESEHNKSAAMPKTQPDLFCPTFTDIAARDCGRAMEFPLFSLSKKPRKQPIEYESQDGIYVQVMPGYECGVATIWDADVLIWCVSQIVEARDRGLTASPVIQLIPYEILKATRRGVGGYDFRRLHDALCRLTQTTIKTNIVTGDSERESQFHWLEGFDVRKVREHYREVTAVIPKWLFDGIMQPGGVLTLNPDYFSLTGGIDRWLYRIARKHAGNQRHGFKVRFSTLHEKSGSLARRSDFAIKLRKAIVTNALPDYHLERTTTKDGAESLLVLPKSVGHARQIKSVIAELGEAMRVVV